MIQPGLVYVIEWNAGGDEIEASASPSTRGCPDQMDDVEMDPREKRRLRRQQKREVLFDEATLEESPGDTVYVAYVKCECPHLSWTNSCADITIGNTSHQYGT